MAMIVFFLSAGVWQLIAGTDISAEQAAGAAILAKEDSQHRSASFTSVSIDVDASADHAKAAILRSRNALIRKESILQPASMEDLDRSKEQDQASKPKRQKPHYLLAAFGRGRRRRPPSPPPPPTTTPTPPTIVKIDGQIRVKYRSNTSKTGLCMNAASGKLQPDDKILLYPCVGDLNEQYVYQTSDYTIRVASKPSVCFKVNGKQSGKAVKLSECSGADTEQFVINDTDSTVRLKAKPELCLNSISSEQLVQGDEIKLKTCLSNADEAPEKGYEKFDLTGLPNVSKALPQVQDDKRIRVLSEPSICLGAGAAASGHNLQLYQCTTHNADEKLEFKYDDEHHAIVLASDDKVCLDAKGGEVKEKDKIVTHSCTWQKNQLFLLYDDGTIHSKHDTTLCFNAEGGKIKAGDKIQLKTCQTRPHEVFNFGKQFFSGTLTKAGITSSPATGDNEGEEAEAKAKASEGGSCAGLFVAVTMLWLHM